MSKKELIGCITGVVMLISVCFGVYFWFEVRYAHAGTMTKAMEIIQKVADRLDRKIVEDRLREVQQKIWTIEDRYCTDKTKPCNEDKMPQTVREHYRELQNEKVDLQNKLVDLNKIKK